MENQLRILLATDYSDLSAYAERYAVYLAKNTNSILIFFHAYQTPSNPLFQSKEFMQGAETLYKFEMKRLEQHCDTLFTSLLIGREVPYECIVREGNNAGKQITQQTEESNVDFLVIGTHGVTGFRKFYFGGHCWDAIKKSNKPIFAVPQSASFKGIKRIVFGLEYHEGEIPGLNCLVHFASMLDAEITILHISNYLPTKKSEREMFKRFKNDVADKMAYAKLKMKLMVNTNISDGVYRFCSENKTDLLVMCPKQSFLFENYFMLNMSMARKTIFHTPLPFLAIPGFYNPEYSGSRKTTNVTEIFKQVRTMALEGYTGDM